MPDEETPKIGDLPSRRELWDYYKLVLEEQEGIAAIHQRLLTVFTGMVSAVTGGAIYIFAQKDIGANSSWLAAIAACVVMVVSGVALLALQRTYDRDIKTVTTRAKIEAALGLDRPRGGISCGRWPAESFVYPEDLESRNRANGSENFLLRAQNDTKFAFQSKFHWIKTPDKNLTSIPFLILILVGEFVLIVALCSALGWR